MNKELDKTLVEKFPKIFVNRYDSPQQTCMCWGFECADAWYNLIDSLCICIQQYLDYKPEVSQVVAKQVKEKFGSLRFYFCGGDEYIRGLVSMIEYLSQSTCEICGNFSNIENKECKCFENKKNNET